MAFPAPLLAIFLLPLDNYEPNLPKYVSLSGRKRIIIGRQTNPKTEPSATNGFFESKVLARRHAQVWQENGKMFIKDTKSIHGTLLNGRRLSESRVESVPFELKTGYVVEFGNDIVGDDDITVVHHKVATRVVCAFTDRDRPPY